MTTGRLEPSHLEGNRHSEEPPALLNTRQGFQRVRRQNLSLFSPRSAVRPGGKELKAQCKELKAKHKEMKARQKETKVGRKEMKVWNRDFSTGYGRLWLLARY